MKSIFSFLVAGSTVMAMATSQAQFVKGNEAVRVMPNGTRLVETPPLPGATLGPPCQATNPACATAGWRMLETTGGLCECTEFYARPGTCRASTYGTEKRPRLWIVKLNGQWMQCQRPDITSQCISIKALPPVIALQ